MTAASQIQSNHFLKVGIEELASKRAELYMLSRSIVNGLGKKRDWGTGWENAPMVEDLRDAEMEDVSLDDSSTASSPSSKQSIEGSPSSVSPAGLDNVVLRTATDNLDDFYRLYEILTDKALRHFTVANYQHAVQTTRADLAVLKAHLKEYREAVGYFAQTRPFFGQEGWTVVELSILVMYARCLERMESTEEYVSVALTLLIKACAAERDRLRNKPKSFLSKGKQEISDLAPIKGVTEKLLKLVGQLSNEIKVPLVDFFASIELVGAPEYPEGRDSCSLSIAMHSLLPEQLTLSGVSLRVVSADNGPCKEIVFSAPGEIIISPGHNRLAIHCNVSGVLKSQV